MMSNAHYWNRLEKPWKKNHKMAEFKFSTFRTTRIVQSQIQEFLDAVSMAILAYQEGMTAYLKEGWQKTAEEKLEQISAYESRGDGLRSGIGMTLYSEMLLPETAADILGLLSDSDHLLDRMRGNFTLMGIEKPEFTADSGEMIGDFVSHACSAMEHTVIASRIYFRDPKGVHDFIHKIHYHQRV
jgi:uncharacterized protein Yka (UPF0111/DUF47 family)